MTDVYEMPVPKPPADAELDKLAVLTDELLSRIDVPTAARQVLRVQATAIRKLRVALAKAESERDSERAIRKIASDERTAAQFGGESCPGVGTPPVAGTVKTPLLDGYHRVVGRCSICNTAVILDGEVIGEHPFGSDPAVRPARPAG